MKKYLYLIFQCLICLMFLPLTLNGEDAETIVFDISKTWCCHFVWGTEPVIWES